MARPLKAARVANNELVIFGRLENGLKEAVRLRACGIMSSRGELATPQADRRRGDLVERNRAEPGEDVDIERIAIPRSGGGSQCCPGRRDTGLDPLLGVDSEGRSPASHAWASPLVWNVVTPG